MPRFIDDENNKTTTMTTDGNFEDGFENNDKYDNSLYSCRDLCYDGPFGIQSTLGKYKFGSEEEEIDIKPEDIKKTRKLIEDETNDVRQDVDKAVNDMDFLSKKEKKAVKRVLFKRIETIKKEFTESLETMSTGFKSWIDDIETELDDKLDEFKDAVAAVLDIQTADYQIWPKTKTKFKTIPISKDYSTDIPDVKSDRKIKIKIDKDSLEQFLCESDGDLENIAMITAENREFDDIEKVVFKILPLDDSCKKRQRAFTEADGKEISDMLNKSGLIKCGWIHTHPFSKTSTFFSGTDVTNTKEMCVLPDDYSLAVVVGCKYLNPVMYMKDGVKAVTERDVEWSLGSMIYQKQNNNKDKIMKLGTDMSKDMSMIKYEVELTIVGKEGQPIEYPNLSQDNSMMEYKHYNDDVKSSLSPAIQNGLYGWNGYWCD